MSSRRGFLKFIGAGLALASCNQYEKLAGKGGANVTQKTIEGLPFIPLKPSNEDKLLLSDGFSFDIVAKAFDPINSSETFGFNNDYTEYVAIPGKKDEIILWVNHEYPGRPTMFHGMNISKKTKAHVDKEREALGGSLLHLKKTNNKWSLVENSKYNRRVTATTPIPYAYGMEINGSKTALGTMGNCAGGKTPWNTFLTCEENVDNYYGAKWFKDEKPHKFRYQWENYYREDPEHYGWVVEVDPFTGKAQKHINLGRIAHECATCVKTKDGRVVVYTGDDRAGEHIYKFISKTGDSFKEGELFVADIKKGKWISLDISKQPNLKNRFKNQVEVYTYVREAAKLVGATPCDRPEDIEINPYNGDVLICLTNNYKSGNFHGEILKISEKSGDHGATSFRSETFLAGGKDNGFSCPDNITFDRNGNLWMTNDIYGKAMSMPNYSSFGNNGLYFIPMKGADAGKVFQVASAPVDAELTGPTFLPDGKTLILSVQHPGELTDDIEKPRSTWPNSDKSPALPSVVAISGPAMEKLLS